ncbi:unnamed protein product [Darwinula stevensoni]|uniref:Uncharacterized protein n=1 Tax=Darwinula stevensoni TaxID=69355 RepID=A0A7R8X5S8_9CRUS|nr:unnamed protein product [Darwinula stevensoni]CAG0885125.1 unnamed protein product [Darwinula stevensoni]
MAGEEEEKKKTEDTEFEPVLSERQKSGVTRTPSPKWCKRTCCWALFQCSMVLTLLAVIVFLVLTVHELETRVKRLEVRIRDVDSFPPDSRSVLHREKRQTGFECHCPPDVREYVNSSGQYASNIEAAA